jgi:predicted MFS family arabinose efflux permease
VIVASLAAGVALLGAFIAWERRTPSPMVPMGLFRNRTYSVTNGVSFFMFFGTFGSIFLLTQVLQNVMGYSPLQAGLRMLVWTGATMIIAPIAGVMAERYGARAFMAVGLALQAGALAWFAVVTDTSVAFSDVVIPFAMAGSGMGLVFAPSASALLSVVSPAQAGQASGTNNAIREVGGVFGVAVLSTIFAESGGLGSPTAFVAGVTPALWVGASVVALGALVALLMPSGRTATVAAEPAAVPVAA